MLVTRYELDLFAKPIATRDLGKPPIVNGEISVDITQTVAGLPPGSYIANVSAVGSGGCSRSTPVSFKK